jgi:uncharacterized protein YjbJ (UPF0337 family)
MNNLKSEVNHVKKVIDDAKDHASAKIEAAQNQVGGKLEQVKGDIKIKVGEVTDNPKLQAQGYVDKAVGVAHEVKGNVQESIIELKKDLKR